MPAGHRVQPDDPTAGVYFPATQLIQERALLPLYFPNGQLSHVACPEFAAYCPVTQLTQVEANTALTTEDDVPDGHLLQLFAPEGAKLPAVQGKQTVDPTGEDDPGGH